MGLWSFLRRWLFGSAGSIPGGSPAGSSSRTQPRRRPAQLKPLKYEPRDSRPDGQGAGAERVGREPPYPFASRIPSTGDFLDLRVDGHSESLREWGLPVCESIPELATWLGIPIGKLAWLADRFGESGRRPASVAAAHYHYQWKPKRGGGARLIESPKGTLRRVQQQILREILDRIPQHNAAHGFRAGRSIVTNAAPHVGQHVLIKFDLQDFYPSVGFSRVTAIFRSLGYNREVALWLARLTTSALPATIPFPQLGPATVIPYLRRHLPQGAPTSPALANVSAYALDVRLSGLARAFGANYTRYADDLTFSGPKRLLAGLKTFLPLVKAVIRDERFRVHPGKTKVIRNNQSQIVTGVVVNSRPNIRGESYDRLKATLHNCLKFGPNTQNRDSVPNFAAVLRGRIEFVRQVNPHRGEKLLAMYQKIRW